MMIILYLTCANDAEAKKIGDALLEAKLVACVRQSPVGSSYWWDGSINHDDEVLLMMESVEAKFDAIETKVKQLHSYDEFVLTAVPVKKTTPGVEAWLQSTLDAPKHSPFYEVFISAETQEQADAILNSLLEKKLATGGQFLASPSRFLWKGAVEEMDYITITSFTTEKHKQELIDDVEATTAEEFPMIRFIPIEVNDKLAVWITQTLE